ncbi:MAG TPA: choice-of-anchor Q domain-containing protein [Chitinivibrionales bacterium]|jgi:hypothetical protein|nr:choice-of-anchor Q domain-containing protein [Chitinivibrionales bacterium]
MRKHLVMMPAALLFTFHLSYSAPILCFSDLASGPKTGNSDISLGQTAGADGAIVTVWGKNLGSSQESSKIFVNGVEARVYSWKNATAPADLFSRHIMQMIEFQVSGSTPDNGTGITVTVNGETSNALAFAVRPASMYFVKTTGSDASGDGTWTKPWQTMPKAVSGMAAGGIVYVCDGVAATTEDSYGGAVNLDRHGSDAQPLSIIAYPGAQVFVGDSSLTYGFGHWESGYGYTNHWNVAKFHITSGEISIPVSTGSRLVGNYITAPTASAAEGTVEADGDNVLILGNEITKAGKYGCSKLYHPLYVSSPRSGTGARYPTESNREIAFNYFHDNNAIRAINIYSEQDSTAFMTHHRVHDNFIINQVSDGMLIGYYTVGENWFYNNIIVKAGLGPDPDPNESGASTHYGVQIDAGHEDTSTIIYFYNNTVYGCGWGKTVSGQGASGNVCITDNSRYTLHFNNNIICSTGEPYVAGWSDADLSKVQAGNNLWFGKGALPSWDATSVNADPKFADTAAGNMHLTNGSAALNAGRDVSAVVSVDFDGVARPQGPAFDIGAYEGVAGAGAVRAVVGRAAHGMMRTSFLSSGMPVAFGTTGQIRIFDRSGRLVRTLNSGEHWNLTDEKGRPAVTGMYLFKSATLSGTVAVIR